MVTLREIHVSHENLLADPNNYRFQEDPEFVFAETRRVHEDTVQSRAFARLRDHGLIQLKQSILRNGLLPIERLIIRQYDHKAESFVVLEGNRRLAAIRWILDDHAAGVAVPAELLKSFVNIRVAIIEDEVDDPAFCKAILGVRHVSGIKEWGGYQRSLLVASLRDDHNLETGEVAERLAMTANEVNRRYRALKALRQMMDDEEYGEHAKPDMYPLFHEAVSSTVVKEWLVWEDANWAFTDEKRTHQFYALLSPRPNEEGTHPDSPKITTREEVRQLRDVLANQEARTVLFDPAHSFLYALTIAKRHEVSQLWMSQISSAIDALNSIPATELRTVAGDNLELLNSLKTTVTEILDSHTRLTAKA